MRFWLCALMIIGGALFLLPERTFATKLDPDASDLWIDRGSSGTATIFVENDADRTKDYSIDFLQVTFGESAEDLTFSPLSAEEKLWFKPSAEKFSMGSGEIRQVDVVVAVPANAEMETKTVAILVREENPGSGVSISTAATSLLFMHIGGDLEWRMELVDYSLRVTNTRAVVSIVLKNTGNDVGLMTGDVKVRNMFGKVIDQLPITEAPKRVPPGTYRTAQVVWPSEEGFSPFLLGRYTFEYVENDTVIATQSAVIISGVLRAVIFVIIFGLFLGILLFVRRRRQ